MAEKAKILEILGLENDEEYTVDGGAVYRIHNGRRQHKYGDEWRLVNNEETLTRLINNPSLIQHKPRFSDEEMTVLRWLHKHGELKRFYKTIDGRVGMTSDGIYGLAGNIADYLLKPGETVDLDEMFKEDENG